MRQLQKIGICIFSLSLVIMGSLAIFPRPVKAYGTYDAWGQVQPYKWGWCNIFDQLGTYNLKITYITSEHSGFPYISFHQVSMNVYYGLQGFVGYCESLQKTKYYMGGSLFGVVFKSTVFIYNWFNPNEWARFVFSVTIMADSPPASGSYKLYGNLLENHITPYTCYHAYGFSYDIQPSDFVLIKDIVPG